nr:response regulator transcription factor [Nocardiopsis mwathae]
MQNTSAEQITVLAVDDNIVVRTGLVALLEATDNIVVVGEAGDGAEALRLTNSLRPDVVLLDVRMPVRDGISVVEEISALTQVIMLTHTEDPEIVHAALRKGASGYMVHGNFGLEELRRALSDAVQGRGTPLSPLAASAVVNSLRDFPESAAAPTDSPAERLGLSTREAEILQTMARGLTNAQIAAELFLAEKTVKNHLNRIFHKLGVSTRTAAIARWNDCTTRPTAQAPRR